VATAALVTQHMHGHRPVDVRRAPSARMLQPAASRGACWDRLPPGDAPLAPVSVEEALQWMQGAFARVPRRKRATLTRARREKQRCTRRARRRSSRRRAWCAQACGRCIACVALTPHRSGRAAAACRGLARGVRGRAPPATWPQARRRHCAHRRRRATPAGCELAARWSSVSCHWRAGQARLIAALNANHQCVLQCVCVRGYIRLHAPPDGVSPVSGCCAPPSSASGVSRLGRAGLSRCCVASPV
jgi:hypothetical protein